MLLVVQMETKLVLFLQRSSFKITEYFHNTILDGQKCEVLLFERCQLNPRFCYIIISVFIYVSFLFIDLFVYFFLVVTVSLSFIKDSLYNMNAA